MGKGTVSKYQRAQGLLLITGLWTPVVATVMVLLELWRIISRHGDPASDVLLCTLALAIALLGPGAWSVDGRLFWMEAHRDRHPKEQALTTSEV